jgi:hypothetical protein
MSRSYGLAPAPPPADYDPVPPAPVLPRAVRNSGGTDKMMGNAPKTASPRLRLKKLIAITVFNFLQQYIYVFFIVEKTILI